MVWNDIITAIVSLVSGGVISTFATLGLTRQKQKADIALAEANAEKAKISAINEEKSANLTALTGLENTIETLEKANERLSKHLDEEQADNVTLKERIEKLEDELHWVRDESESKGHAVCMHFGCIARRPPHGEGNTYYKRNFREGKISVDYDTIEEILTKLKKK